MLQYALKKRICPLVQNPLGDCYCFNMGSQDIEKAIYYCNKNFKICEIYKVRYFEHNEVSIDN